MKRVRKNLAFPFVFWRPCIKTVRLPCLVKARINPRGLQDKING